MIALQIASVDVLWLTSHCWNILKWSFSCQKLVLVDCIQSWVLYDSPCFGQLMLKLCGLTIHDLHSLLIFLSSLPQSFQLLNCDVHLILQKVKFQQRRDQDSALQLTRAILEAYAIVLVWHSTLRLIIIRIGLFPPFLLRPSRPLRCLANGKVATRFAFQLWKIA